VQFFPADAGQIENAAPQELTAAPGGIALALERAEQDVGPLERLRGTLVAAAGFPPDGAKAIAIDVPVRDLAATQTSSNRRQAAVAGDAPTATSRGLSLWLAVALAFAGGVLLNVMPCVFPVLSIKILDFVRQTGGRSATLLHHGLAYAAGGSSPEC
jgi:thiol:disulfide interchange protein DsbD